MAKEPSNVKQVFQNHVCKIGLKKAEEKRCKNGYKLKKINYKCRRNN